jgi:hypothetical protein
MRITNESLHLSLTTDATKTVKQLLLCSFFGGYEILLRTGSDADIYIAKSISKNSSSNPPKLRRSSILFLEMIGFSSKFDTCTVLSDKTIIAFSIVD